MAFPDDSEFPVLDRSVAQAARNCALLESDPSQGLWIECCSRRFFPFARSLLRDDQLALDILQESWIKILQAVRLEVGGPAACPWVASVVRNTAIDSLRQRQRRREVPLDSASDPPASTDIAISAEQVQLLALLREMILLLPPTYRRVVQLRVQQGLSTKETARALGISPSSVSTRLSRAVRILERRIQGRLDTANSAPRASGP